MVIMKKVERDQRLSSWSSQWSLISRISWLFTSVRCWVQSSSQSTFLRSWFWRSSMSETKRLMSARDSVLLRFSCMRSWAWQPAQRHLFSFYSACQTLRVRSAKCLRQDSTSAQRLLRELRLLLYSSLRFLNFSSQTSRLDRCRSNFFSPSLNYYAILVSCQCRLISSLCLNETSYEARFARSCWLRAFSSISFSSSAFQQHFRSQNEYFSIKAASLDVNSRKWLSISAWSFCLLAKS